MAHYEDVAKRTAALLAAEDEDFVREDARSVMRTALEIADQGRIEHAERLCRRLASRLQGELEAGSNPPELRDQWVFATQTLAWLTSANPYKQQPERHHGALRLIDQVVMLGRGGPKEHAHTNGVRGGILYRLWSYSGSHHDLRRARTAYRKAMDLGPHYREGYAGVVAAHLTDHLAYEAIKQDPEGSRNEAELLMREAQRIREDVLRAIDIPGQRDSYWLSLNRGQLLFGLRRYEEAKRELQQAFSQLHEKNSWRMGQVVERLAQLAVRQQALISRLEKNPSPEEEEARWACLDATLPKSVSLLNTSLRTGKVGLTLSGGGFRASIFHLGVLAALADMDLLRHVEVLSCVSGGSIIGAYYQLHVRRMLESKEDAELNPRSYQTLVERIIDEFLKGTRKNIRNSLFSNPLRSLRFFGMTTRRLGELLGKHFYRPILQTRKPVELTALEIHPLGEDQEFTPRLHNWKRRNKAPLCILNATTLNTGNCWHFTGSFMGEPPLPSNTVSKHSVRLRRVEIAKLKKHARPTLEEAVAASAAVPGIFPPYRIRRSHDRPWRPLLVDGGVHDNQGIAGLMGLDCRVCLVSDAAGLLNAYPSMSDGPLSVLFRANGILMGRIREAQIESLRKAQEIGQLQTRVITLAPTKSTGAIGSLTSSYHGSSSNQDKLDSRFDERIVELLTLVRTDLDAFGQSEAYALMALAYERTLQSLEQNPIPGLPAKRIPNRNRWVFESIERAMEQGNAALIQQLDIARLQTFKPWHLLWRWQPRMTQWLFSSLVSLIAIAAVASTCLQVPFAVDLPFLPKTPLWRSVLVITLVVAWFSRTHIMRLLVCFTAWIPFQLYQWILNPMYLWQCGRWERDARSPKAVLHRNPIVGGRGGAKKATIVD